MAGTPYNARGERHPNHKLTEEQVQALRDEYGNNKDA
jgi:hypothetical protein